MGRIPLQQQLRSAVPPIRQQILIGVSTDGLNNLGANPTAAANAALGNGISTNCLGTGGVACSFATGFTAQVS